MALEINSLGFHSSIGHQILPSQPDASLWEEVFAKFKLFYKQNVTFHLKDVLRVEYPCVQILLGQVVNFRVWAGFGQAQADVEEVFGVELHLDLPGWVVFSIRNPVVHLERSNIIYQVGFH